MVQIEGPDLARGCDEGLFVPLDWLAVIFNPSFPYRLVHMVLAAYLTTALVVGAVGAWHLLRERANPGARAMFSMAMWMLACVAPLQILAGDAHGLNTLEHQPAKVMAMEGHFQSHPDGAPLILFGLPDEEAATVRYALQVPKLSSLILQHSLDAPLAGLDTVPREELNAAYIIPSRTANASRAPVMSNPLSSSNFPRRYRTVLGCTNRARAVASRLLHSRNAVTVSRALARTFSASDTRSVSWRRARWSPPKARSASNSSA